MDENLAFSKQTNKVNLCSNKHNGDDASWSTVCEIYAN